MSSRFVAPFAVLETRELRDDAHQLLRPLVYESDVLRAYRATLVDLVGSWDHVLTVPAGFVTDFMSVPRWIPIAHSLIAGMARRAGAIHDFLYQTHIVPRRIGDAVLPEAMEACHQAWWRQHMGWDGVRIGGRRAYRTGPARKQVLAAITVVDPLGEV